MCGIVGIVSESTFTSAELLTRLQRLDYRGYDSYGYWNGLNLFRRVGSVSVEDDGTPVNCAIAHTRWATHGAVTETNAHPHRSKRVAIVHNGIISNWLDIKSDLGLNCVSETDSEVIAWLIECLVELGRSPLDAVRDAASRLEGTFAFLAMIDGDPMIYAARRGSPLVIGVCKGRMIASSDLYAFSDATTRSVWLQDGDVAAISPAGCEILDQRGRVHREPEHFTWDAEQRELGEFRHYMRLEIEETPSAALRLLLSLSQEQAREIERLRSQRPLGLSLPRIRTILTGSGSAHHACMFGAALMKSAGFNAVSIPACEFECSEGDFVIAVSQSGETMDVIQALQKALSKGCFTGGIVNVPLSTVERMVDFKLRIMAGQETSVAATKSFICQCLALMMMASPAASKIPAKLSLVLGLEDMIRREAERLVFSSSLLVIGRGLCWPIACETALKIKEVSYRHAEAVLAGELKHGALALVQPGTPVVAFCYRDDPRMKATISELEARGAKVVRIHDVLPTDTEAEFALLAAMVGQLLAYHMGRLRGCEIDKPRNLAKSVTVL